MIEFWGCEIRDPTPEVQWTTTEEIDKWELSREASIEIGKWHTGTTEKSSLSIKRSEKQLKPTSKNWRSTTTESINKLMPAVDRQKMEAMTTRGDTFESSEWRYAMTAKTSILTTWTLQAKLHRSLIAYITSNSFKDPSTSKKVA